MLNHLRQFQVVLFFLLSGSFSWAENAKLELQFEQQIRPVLIEKCIKCHGAKKQESELRLDSREAMIKGGENGPAVIPGKPQESLLVHALKHDGLEMPPEELMPEKTVFQFEKWISQGAIWPIGSQQLRERGSKISDEDRQWWAFQPVQKPNIPQLAGDTWSVNPIDRFVYRKLKQHGIEPAPQAPKSTLVRRLYFDLIGLPPSPAQIDEFASDSSPKSWENLVDKLLDDKRYGEQWARHWLDIVRYSESDGWKADAYRPHIWRYRDYVVAAFNSDKPYPDFVREQLAGDEISGDEPEHYAAAGFLRLGIYEYNQRNARQHWDDIMNEMTDVASDVFLGMSLACARCHDHKFDPVLQADYFALRAFFEPLSWRDDIPAATRQQQDSYNQEVAAWQNETTELRARMDALLKPYHEKKWKATVDKFPLEIQACFHKPAAERSSWEQQMAYLVERQFEEEGGGPLNKMKKADKTEYDELQQKLAELGKPTPLPPLMTVSDFVENLSPTMIPDDAGKTPIEPAFLTVLAKQRPHELIEDEPISGSTGRRSSLAKWIGHPDNPLSTRVIVNRIWQQHFGQGIVATPNDFGRKGQLPTHPELLDWLTTSFVENGWSVKHLHRLILTSATWQQSAQHPDSVRNQAIDPSDSLLWRARVRRLTAEQIRDALLTVSGELQPKVGGPSVDEKTPRRSLYVKRFRNKNDTFLHGFDVANGLKSVAARDTTTTPNQSLLLINGSYALGRAKKLAAKLENTEFSRNADRVRYAFRLVWGRSPTDDELDRSLTFLGARDERAKIKSESVVDFCHVLVNSNEFLYVD